MNAEAGDELVIEDQGHAHGSRIGTVVEVRDADGVPRYLVRWLSDYESVICPTPADHIEVHHHPST